MTIEEIIGKKELPEIVKNLAVVENELAMLTNRIDRVINPNVLKSKDEIFKNIRSLRIETENLLREIEGVKRIRDIDFIKRVAGRIKEIIKTKTELETELKAAEEKKGLNN